MSNANVFGILLSHAMLDWWTFVKTIEQIESHLKTATRWKVTCFYYFYTETMIQTSNTRKMSRIILVIHGRKYGWNYALIYSKYLNLTTWIVKRSQKAILQIYATVTLRPLLEIVTTVWAVNAFFGWFFVVWFIISLVLQGSHTQC